MKAFLFSFVVSMSLVSTESQPIVGLSVKERAGVARINEPVLTGVPLPESLYTNLNDFALKDAQGNVVPCEFRTAAKWWRDKQSIRWVHLDFQTPLAANEDKKFTLSIDPASHAVSGSKLKITDLGAKYQVDTGPLRFTVKKTGFNLFDEAWVDESGNQVFDAAHQVVTSHAKGFSHLSAGTRYYAANDAAATASIERQGPMSAVLKIEGRLKNASGQQSFHYLTRIYAYNNSKTVKVVFSFENRTSDISQYLPLHGLNMELPLNLSAAQFTLGAKTALKTGSLQSSDEAYLHVNNIDDYRYGGVVSGSGNTKLDQNIDWGWAALKDGQKGVAVGVKWFWQNYPSSIEMNGAGLFNVGLFSHRFTGGSTAFPPRQANHYQIYSGMSKTHEMRFVFFNDDADGEVRSQVAGVNSTLYAFSTPAWYCRATRALGEMVEYNNPSLYTGTRWNLIRPYDLAIYNGALKCVGNTGAVYGGKDAYDYFGWGDNPHQLLGPQELLWNGNYYDLPHMMAQMFVRTLDYRFFDYYDAHSAHVQDLHLVHFEANDPNDGSNRYCPFTNHIGADALQPDVQTHTSHHKTQCLWEKYYLLGDDRALDMAQRGLKKIKSYGTSMTADVTTYLRRPAHVLFTLTMGYKHTLASTELSAIQSNYVALRDRLAVTANPGANWQVGLVTESMIDAHQILDNPEILQVIKSVHDKVSNLTAVAAYGLAYTSAALNAPAYFARIPSAMSNFGNGVSFGHHEKDYAENGHSLHRMAYYYAIPDSAMNRQINTGAAIEAGKRGAAPVMAIFPNPFNEMSSIVLPAAASSLKIYDTRGRLVEDLTPGLKAGAGEVRWSGRALAPGVYVAQMEVGGKVSSRRLTLLR